MLSNTLAIIEIVLNKQKNNKITPEVIEFLKNYKKGMWIYPGVLRRKFKLNISEVYSFLCELEKQGILQSYYELYCSHCQKSIGIVKLFSELTPTFECELCNEELPTLENSIIIYKVLRDD